MCRSQDSNFSHFCRFWRKFLTSEASKKFLGMLWQWYGYVKHCARSYLFSALWIRCIRRFNPILSYKMWLTHGFLADMALLVTPPLVRDANADFVADSWNDTMNQKTFVVQKLLLSYKSPGAYYHLTIFLTFCRMVDLAKCIRLQFSKTINVRTYNDAN